MPKNQLLHLALPKGRMQEGVFALFEEAGIQLKILERGYRPTLSLAGFETKILKPQNIIEMLHAGSRDLGFAGLDWVRELRADLVEVLDTGLDPVRMVLAAPPSILQKGKLVKKSLVIATEYKNLTEDWLKKRKLNATVVRSYGATEVFPPEDADAIVDITQTGSTLRENNLEIVDEFLTSSTRLFANPKALRDPAKREKIDRLVLVLKSVLEARNRVMVEINVSKKNLSRLVKLLPCMREPTISTLHGDAGYAVKVAVPRSDLPELIPAIKACGGSDIVVTRLAHLVP